MKLTERQNDCMLAIGNGNHYTGDIALSMFPANQDAWSSRVRVARRTSRQLVSKGLATESGNYLYNQCQFELTEKGQKIWESKVSIVSYG